VPTTYFDANVYDHIDKGYIPAEEVDAVRTAINRGAMVPYFSLIDVEEVVGQWETDRPAAVRKLRLARDLVGFRRMLKPTFMLMEDGVRAYAAGKQPPAPILPRDQRLFIQRELNRIAADSPTLSREVSGIVADVRRTKESFRDSMARALERTLAELKPETYSDEERRALTFEGFWARAAGPWAEAFAERVGVAPACRERGLDGLLNVRAVRLAVGAALSLVFSQVIERRKPDLGDGYDQWHAIQASAVEVFVTRDTRLARHLMRVPILDFRVLTSLRELLQSTTPGTG
jgi:hypothetical protein